MFSSNPDLCHIPLCLYFQTQVFGSPFYKEHPVLASWMLYLTSEDDRQLQKFSFPPHRMVSASSALPFSAW